MLRWSLSHQHEATVPGIDPLPLGRLPHAFDHPEWIFEWKADGFRCLAYIVPGKRAVLVSRKGHVYKSFAPLRDALATALPFPAVLDGELVCLDAEGRTVFSTLLRRREPPRFYCFDVLWADGRDYRELPLIQRKAVLETLIPKPTPHLFVAQHVVGRGHDLFAAVCERDCEGIVAKWATSPYRLLGGRSPWQKVLNPRYSQRERRHKLFAGFNDAAARS